MSLDILKQRIGYSGKPLQFQRGFDLAVRELHHQPVHTATMVAIKWFEARSDLCAEGASILAGLKQMTQPTHSVDGELYTVVGTAHGAGLSRGLYIHLYASVETGQWFFRNHVDFVNRVKPLVFDGKFHPRPLPFEDEV